MMGPPDPKLPDPKPPDPYEAAAADPPKPEELPKAPTPTGLPKPTPAELPKPLETPKAPTELPKPPAEAELKLAAPTDPPYWALAVAATARSTSTGFICKGKHARLAF